VASLSVTGDVRGDAAEVTAGSTAEVLRRVPSCHRRFTEPEREATAFHRIPRALLEELLDLGLPHTVQAGDRLFHRKDLVNIALRHRLPSPQRRALQNLAAAFRGDDSGEPMRRLLDITASCPAPGHPGPCLLRPAGGLVHGPAVRRCTVIRPGHLRVELELAAGRGDGPGLPAAERELLAPLADVEFHQLPGPLTTDLGFLREARLADCRLAGHDVLTRAGPAGIAARPAFGLLVARPFSTVHRWVEFRDPAGDGWICGDAFFVAALDRWGLLDGAGWPQAPAAGAPYWRLGDDLEALITHRGETVRWSVITR
jgi:hypothetical protein